MNFLKAGRCKTTSRLSLKRSLFFTRGKCGRAKLPALQKYVGY